jgi:hypothetical protein
MIRSQVKEGQLLNFATPAIALRAFTTAYNAVDHLQFALDRERARVRTHFPKGKAGDLRCEVYFEPDADRHRTVYDSPSMTKAICQLPPGSVIAVAGHPPKGKRASGKGITLDLGKGKIYMPDGKFGYVQLDNCRPLFPPGKLARLFDRSLDPATMARKRSDASGGGRD